MPKKLIIALALGFSLLVYASFPNIARAETYHITGMSLESSSSSISFFGLGGGSSKRTLKGIDSSGVERILIREEDGRSSAFYLTNRGREIPVRGSVRTLDRAISRGCLKLEVENDRLVKYESTCDHSEAESEGDAVDAG